MTGYNFNSHAVWSFAIIGFRRTEQTTSPAKSNWHVVWQRFLKPEQNKTAPKNKNKIANQPTESIAICRKWDGTWRNEFWTHVTLKPLANISLSKYRRDSQVQKQQSLKMIKAQFSWSIFMLCREANHCREKKIYEVE